MTVATCFSSLMMAWPWEAIRGCPGRYVMALQDEVVTLEDLIGPEGAFTEHRVPSAPDPVFVATLSDGGLISYLKAGGRFVHTLNTPEAFQRKLAQLGLDL